jgi:hypothetical protein
MRSPIAVMALALVFIGCELETGEVTPDAGGTAGTMGGTDQSGGNGGAGGPGTGGAGTGGAGTGGFGKGGSGTGGGSGMPGTGGMSTGGTGGGSSGGTGGSSGSGGCVENLGCELEAPASTGDIHQDCVDRINQFRTVCACLEPLERWTEGEACADQMAQYDSERDEAHAGFQDDICDGGFGQNECPGWRSEEQVISGCLQAMWDEGPPPTDPCNGQCFQDHGHFINMTNPSHSRVACGFYTTPGGEVWAVQNFAR